MLVLIVAAGLAVARPLHAQEATGYTEAQADADVEVVLGATGEAYEAAHARLMGRPEFALKRVYQRTARPLTAAERERLATMAEALAGAQAREQILSPPLQVVTDDAPPEPSAQPPSAPEPSARPPVPRVPSAQPEPSAQPQGPERGPTPTPGPAKEPGASQSAGIGVVLLAVGAGAVGAGIYFVRMPNGVDDQGRSSRCCDLLGGALIGAGALFTGLSTWLLARGVKEHRAAKEAALRRRIQLAPAVARSPRGTATAGLVLRF